jgi:hypothetical protein
MTIRPLLSVTQSHTDRWWVHVHYYTNFHEHPLRQHFVGHAQGYWLLGLSCCMTVPASHGADHLVPVAVLGLRAA